MKSNTLLVTGGAGFIGSCLVRQLVEETTYRVITIDKLTYAGHLESLAEVAGNERHKFEKVDICNIKSVNEIFDSYKPVGIIHLAAESHVDRSIDSPSDFITTNICGTYNLLEISRKYLASLDAELKRKFRFLHVSTDEVYGSLGPTGLFTEQSSYKPNSPYSASKASSDHLARAWHATYNLPIIITNCSNNYGPYQLPEKLIPMTILNALSERPLPIYGSGENIRDWLYVEDHTRALRLVLEQGKIGETYNIGGCNEMMNVEIVNELCSLLDKKSPKPTGGSYKELITFVKDRPGHDARYAIDASKIKKELGWLPRESIQTGLKKTVEWYLDNSDWCNLMISNKDILHRKGLSKDTI